ncbi:nodulation protein NodJ [Cupriavidus sp. USMAA2-4]|uniref:Transport permease protein n=1 Tax=Cupriavidus malaysiensis TaxID=367825 RepID=A0A1D9I4X3_9BURK|nr:MULTISPECIES: ABC transporter permease [Cupriavidus]AOY93346.1 nodulation protein NodJ [Cupriavidus sp. USMAA2-4]AOZ00362.1 nodulation protein NodJ [Cupriavidus sp. USMAHM13]AOZ07108.1 nodulation protein NodJ [Cupriavidus malaysiensis]
MAEQDPRTPLPPVAPTRAAPPASVPAQRYPQPLWPRNLRNWTMVWYRNFMVWKKLAVPSMIGNLADPMIYLFGLGLGLGMLVGHVSGVSYIAFLAAGTTASSVMMSASFEAMYSAFSRMHVQRTWEAIMHAPLTLGDVVLGEIAWAASKAVLSGTAIMLVAGVLGYAHWSGMLPALAVIALAGLAFAGLATIVTALAPSYDFFMFYQTLAMTPMLLLSGVFFPLEQLPSAVQAAAKALPLAHAVALIRPLLLGWPLQGAWLHVAVLAAYALAALLVSLMLLRRRLLR